MSVARPSLARVALLAAALFTALALLAPAADAKKKPKKAKKAPTSFVVKGGETMLTLDPALSPVLAQQNIAVNGIAPAVVDGETVTLPISGGKLDIKKKTLTLKHRGGLSLAGEGLPLTIDVKNAVIEQSRGKGVLKADTVLGSGTPLLDVKGLKFPASIKRKSIALTGKSAFVSSIGGTLQGFVPGLPGPPVPFGTISVTLELK
jgi:uncharacterized membrane protein